MEPCIKKSGFKLEWEEIPGDRIKDPILYRSKTPGGWLVSSKNGMYGWGVCFVPDPEHIWLSDKLPTYTAGVHAGTDT